MESIEEAVVQTIAKALNIDASIIKKESKVVEDLHAKSVNLIGLTALLEKEFGAEFQFSEISSAKTVDDLLRIVARQIR